MLRSFRVTLFPCCIFSVLSAFHVTLFSCCAFIVLHFYHVTLCFMLKFFMLHLFRVVLFWCCIFLHVAPFSWCTFSHVASCCAHFLLQIFRDLLISSCTLFKLDLLSIGTFFVLHSFDIAAFFVLHYFDNNFDNFVIHCSAFFLIFFVLFHVIGKDNKSSWKAASCNYMKPNSANEIQCINTTRECAG